MPPSSLKKRPDLARAAEIGIGLHVDFLLREAKAAWGAGEEPGHALTHGSWDFVVEIGVSVFEGEKVWPGEVGEYEEMEFLGKVEHGREWSVGGRGEGRSIWSGA